MPPSPPSKAAAAAAPVLAAALFAAAEMALGLWIAGMWLSGRAEAIGFLAFRPFLLVFLALAVSARPLRRRLVFYAAALGLAGLAEALLLAAWGAPWPWPEMLRGWTAGTVAAILADLAVQAGRRFGRAAAGGVAFALIVLLFAPPVQRLWERAALADLSPPASTTEKPELMVMTALPIVWGEGGAFDPASRPAAAYRALQEEYDVRLLDTLDADRLAGGRLLLLAQPRWLSPGELVALDAWVRGGGRALILTDPRLEWPSPLPIGDVRRAPPVGLLRPLLDHWGVELVPGIGRGTWQVDGRLVRLDSPGRLEVEGSGCRTGPSWLAACRLGEGKAVLVADADLLRDDLWTGFGPRGHERNRRIADNPLFLADRLDALAGIERPRRGGGVDWAGEGRRTERSLLVAFALLFALGLAGAAGLLRSRRRAA